jgi:hypothetical protein
VLEPAGRVQMRIVVEWPDGLPLDGKPSGSMDSTSTKSSSLERFARRSSGAEMEVTPSHRLDPQPELGWVN